MERPEDVINPQATRSEQSSSSENNFSEFVSPGNSHFIATSKLQAEQVAVRRIQATVYTNSAEALTRASPAISASLPTVLISPATPATTPLLSTATADIKNLHTEEIIASVVIDEKMSSSETISLQNATPTVIKQQIQINAGIAVLMPPKVEAKVDALTAQLKNYYQQYDNKIKRVFGAPLDIDKGFVNLSIVLNDEQKQDEKDKLRSYLDRTKFYSSYEDIYSTKEKEIISPQDLFKERNNKIPKRIAVIGRAGIGKSIFSQYLTTYLWAGNNCWQSMFDIVIKIQLRNLTKENYDKNPSLADVISIEFTDSSGITAKLEKAEIEATLKSISNRILVVLDGWDEFNLKTSPCAKLILDLLRNPTLSIIVTSRPYTNLNEKDFDLLLECIGFTTENIPEYINRVCEDKIQVPLIIAFLKRNPAIHSLAHIPIILDMIICIWDDEMRARIEPMTMTELYSKMIAKLWKVYIEKQQGQCPGIDEEKLCQKKEQTKAFLSLLAFKAIQNNTILLNYQLVEKAIKDTYQCSDEDVEQKLKEALSAGFINASDSKNYRGYYYFPHLTIQEYMAAKYWVKLFISDNKADKDQAILLFIENKFNPRFEIIWWFVAGILIEGNNNSAVQLFFDIIIEKNTDIISYYEKLLLIRCVEEAKIPIFLKQRADLLATFKYLVNAWINKFNYSNSPKNPGKIYPALHIKTYLLLCPNIVFETEICDALIQGLYSIRHFSFRDELGKLIYELADQHIITKYIPQLLEYICYGGEDYYIAKALARTIESEPLKIYMELVDKANDNFEIRKTLLLAVFQTSNTFKERNKEKVFSYIINAMNQNSEQLIIIVIEECRKLQKTDITLIIDQLTILLSHANPTIRRRALEGLIEIIPDINKKLSILQSAINDIDAFVKKYAITEILKLDDKFPSLILPICTYLLTNEKLDIKLKFCFLEWRKFTSIINLNNVINSLLDTLLQSQNIALIKEMLKIIRSMFRNDLYEDNTPDKMLIILKAFVKKIKMYDEESQEKIEPLLSGEISEYENNIQILEISIHEQKTVIIDISMVFLRMGKAQIEVAWNYSADLMKKFHIELHELHQLSGLDVSILFALAGLLDRVVHQKTEAAAWELVKLIKSNNKITIQDILGHMPEFLIGLDGAKAVKLFLISLSNSYPDKIIPLLIAACLHENRLVRKNISQVLSNINLTPYLSKIKFKENENIYVMVSTFDSTPINSLIGGYISNQFNCSILFKVLVYKFMNISAAVYFNSNDLCFYENSFLQQITFPKHLINDFILKMQQELQEITGIKPGLINSITSYSSLFENELPEATLNNAKCKLEIAENYRAWHSFSEKCLIS